ncbi:hypothetical protein I4U23_020005 [Adineta vaga]|nr:hypothetical protein I4U23_020005 [Adineta vaga]
MIITVLPVPPLCVRPSVLLFGTARCQDDLTYNLARIINANNTLSEAEQCSASPHIIDKYWQDLQTSCATLINNDISGMPKLTQKDGRPLKSLTERLKGKEGRIRGNIMGKRVDFSARSVITADPNLAIDQVGVPQSIAQNLTVPEMVTPYNKDWLQELIIRRVAKHIILEDGSRINLKYHPCPSDISLQYGYIVERQMMDDDLVVFNRQPSLHKMSMMAHRVKILPWSTFRLNLSVTTPYNADFDGDEMNLHLPQSLEARAELAQLMTVPRLLITPQSNRPVMGIVQDTLTAVTKMTRRDVFIDKNELMNLLMHIPSWNGKIPPATILKPKPLWTGKQLISLLLPRQVNCIRTRSDEKDEQSFEWISPSDSKLLVENGQLLSGILCTQTLGPNAGSLGHIIFMECGHDVAGKFYSSMQLLVNHWLLIEGHSVGISDTIIDETTTEIIHHRIEQSEYEVQKLITDIRTKQSSLSFFSRQSFENTINEHLNKVRNEAGSLAQKSLTNFNQFKAMVDSGAKGKALNIFQIIVCVGQQNVEGKRIPFGFKGRTLPHFLQDDYGAKAHGFVKKSYLQGLTPAEFFFHAMGGREGLIDTAIKTAETGYIQRRLVKAMESVMVKYDGTVRNQNEHIIQFVYGEDGLAGENVEFQSILSLQPADISFQNLCKFDLPNKKEDLQQFLNSNIINDLFSNEESLQVLNNEWEQLCQDRKHLREVFPRGDNSRIVLPCNIARLIHNARKLFHISKQTQSNLSPIKLIQDLNNLTERLTVIKGTDSISHEAQYNATLLMNILVRSSLCSKQILQEHHLTSEAFDWLCGEIETRFQQAQVQPGEMVGVLAAQSIGEPATQMTLNTFHYAGVSAKNVTLGVPRLKEIINLSKNPKTPSMTIFPDVHVDNNDSHTYAQIISRLENCTLKHITLNSKVYYDPDPRTTVIQEDQNWINDYNELPDSNHLQTSPWLLRIELDQRKICHKFLTMEEVVEKLPRKLFDCEGEDDLHVIYSDDNADHLVLHIRLVDKPKTMSDNENISEEDKSTQLDDDSLLRFLDTEVFANLTLKGNKSISKAYRVETKTFAPNDWRKRFIISGEGTMKASDEHCVVTNGSAFQYALTMKGIDYRRTYTNDVIEVFCVLGVEAVRKAIEYELNHVLSYDGAYVNHRHLSLLCDVMTTKGHLLPITRHGINRQDFSPIMRSSFEETVGVFIDAAANAEFDALKGVSESIALGQLAKIGTGTFDLFVDMKKCPLAMEVLTTNISTVSGYDTPPLVATTPWIKSIATTPSYQ